MKKESPALLISEVCSLIEACKIPDVSKLWLDKIENGC